MISELNFSRGYQSFWNKAFPFLSRVISRVNLEKKHYEGYFNSDSDPGRRAIVNETGFRLFEYIIKSGISNAGEIPQNAIQEIQDCTRRYINGIQKNALFVDSGKNSKEELEESFRICNRLREYFIHNEPQKEIIVSPYFKGCGVLNGCYGDALCDSTLYEVKAGDREFRAIDVKQLLIYCALANLEKSIVIKDIGLINPRNGIYAVISVRDTVDIASGISIQEAFSEITNYLDSPDDFK